jgi:hypothetical protein
LATKTKKEKIMPKKLRGVLETPEEEVKEEETAPTNAVVTCPACGTEFEAPAAPEEEPAAEEGEPEKEEKPVDVKAAVKAALTTERKRVAAITEIGEKFGFREAAKAAVDGDVSVDAFRKQILDQSPEDWRASLTVRNPALQASERDMTGGGTAAGAVAVDEIKRRRASKYGGV